MLLWYSHHSSATCGSDNPPSSSPKSNVGVYVAVVAIIALVVAGCYCYRRNSSALHEAGEKAFPSLFVSSNVIIHPWRPALPLNHMGDFSTSDARLLGGFAPSAPRVDQVNEHKEGEQYQQEAKKNQGPEDESTFLVHDQHRMMSSSMSGTRPDLF